MNIHLSQTEQLRSREFIVRRRSEILAIIRNMAWSDFCCIKNISELKLSREDHESTILRMMRSTVHSREHCRVAIEYERGSLSDSDCVDKYFVKSLAIASSTDFYGVSICVRALWLKGMPTSIESQRIEGTILRVFPRKASHYKDG